jgi:hypothetical protein
MRRTLSLIFILVLSACSGSGSEGPELTFADFNSPPTTVDSPATSTTPPTSTSTSTSTSTTTTLLVVDTPGAVSITADSGYAILEGRGAPHELVERPVAAAFDDLQGGFVFQFPGAGTDAAADQRIYWSRAAAPEARARLDVSEGSLLRLWGTEVIGGSPQMILTVVDDAADPAARVERLVLYDFATDRVLGEVGGAESGPVTLDYGGGRFVLEQRAGVQSFFEFRNDQGAVIELASNPNPGCADDVACPAHPAIDPSGSFLAYLQAGPDGGYELVILDLDLDEEVSRIGLPSPLGEVTGVDFDGTTALVNRITSTGDALALVVDTAAGSYGEFGLPGMLRFLRMGPAFEGSILLPSS